MPFPIKTEAIVLHSVNYRDFDRMVTLFSREHGRVSFMARGAHRAGHQYMAPTTMFCLGEYVLNERGGQYSLKSCSVEKNHYGLRESPVHLSCGALAAQLCLEVIQQGEPNEELFLLLLQLLVYLENKVEDEKALMTAFLMRFMDAIGQNMVLNSCAHCHGRLRDARIDFEKGGTVCFEHAAPDSPVATKELILCLLGCRAAAGLEPARGFIDQAYYIMRDYVQYRLEKWMPGFSYMEKMIGIEDRAQG